jgi:hypothetical protein
MMKKSTMDALLTVALQMARVAAFETSKQQAVASLIVSEDDNPERIMLLLACTLNDCHLNFGALDIPNPERQSSMSPQLFKSNVKF